MNKIKFIFASLAFVLAIGGAIATSAKSALVPVPVFYIEPTIPVTCLEPAGRCEPTNTDFCQAPNGKLLTDDDQTCVQLKGDFIIE